MLKGRVVERYFYIDEGVSESKEVMRSKVRIMKRRDEVE